MEMKNLVTGWRSFNKTDVCVDKENWWDTLGEEKKMIGDVTLLIIKGQSSAEMITIIRNAELRRCSWHLWNYWATSIYFVKYNKCSKLVTSVPTQTKPKQSVPLTVGFIGSLLHETLNERRIQIMTVWRKLILWSRYTILYRYKF